MLGTINVTVTNVAFSDIVASFPGVSPSLTGWILTGYALSFATMMLAAGRLADRYGRLRVFRLGLAGLRIPDLREVRHALSRRLVVDVLDPVPRPPLLS